MNRRALFLLPLALTLAACGVASGDETSADESSLSRTCADACSIDAVRNADLRKVDVSVERELQNALGAAMAARGTGFVRLAREMTKDEITAIGLEPRAIIGKIVTVDFTLEGLLRASQSEDVISFQEGAPLQPPTPGAQDETSTQPPNALVRHEPAVNVLRNALVAKLDSRLRRTVDATLLQALSTKLSGFYRFAAAKTQAEIVALGIEPRAIIGTIVTANFTLAAMLETTRRADVVKIEGARPLFPQPGTGDPGGSDDVGNAAF
jgi:hypothetical protein